MARLASRLRTQVTVVLVVIGLAGSAAFALTEQPIAGQKITLKRSSSGKERLRAVLKDGALLFPAFDQPGDPSLDGLTVVLIGAGGEHVEFYVPPGLGKPGWKRIFPAQWDPKLGIHVT